MEKKLCSTHPDSKSSLKNNSNHKRVKQYYKLWYDNRKKCVLFLSVQKNGKIQHHNSSLTDLQYSPSSTQIRWARMGEFFSSDNRSRKCSSMSSTIPSHCKIKIWIRKKNVKKSRSFVYVQATRGKIPYILTIFSPFFSFSRFFKSAKKKFFFYDF